MRISDWSSDVCSSDLEVAVDAQRIRIRPGRTDQRADLTNPGIPAIGGERAELRIEFLGLQPVIAARGDDHGRFLEIEGFNEPKVDRAGDPAFDQIGGLRLVDIDARESVGGQILMIEIVAGGGKDLAPDEGERTRVGWGKKE